MVHSQTNLVHVIQGQFETCDKPETVLTTVLGSCVAACLFDPVARIGGMNHFLLPESNSGSSSAVVFGAQAMELLINDLLKRGAVKSRLKAKLFGGANVLSGLSDIGSRNSEFAENYLRLEGIDCVGMSLRGFQARRVRFSPVDGRASQKLISEDVVEPVAPPPPKRAAPEVDFF